MSRRINIDGINVLLFFYTNATHLGRLEIYNLLAKRFRCSPSFIQKHIPQDTKNRLLDKRGKRPSVDHQAIITLYTCSSYRYQRDIGIALGCSESVVSKVIMKYRLKQAEQAMSQRQKTI